MARIDELERARQEGMSYALEVARKKGVEGLEEELRMRGVTGIPIGFSRSAVDKVIENIKEQMFDTVNILTAMTLHDEFGFGAARIERFRKRFDFKTECLMEDNELVKKLFRTPQCERVLLLSSWSDEELWETLEALQNIRNNKQKIDLINTELNARSKESGMTFQSSVKEKEFCEKWTEMQRLFGKGVNHEIRHTP